MTVKPSGYKSALSSIAGLVFPLLFFVIATPYAIASFGEDKFGLLLLILSLQAVVLSVDFGLSSGGVVLIARHMANGDIASASRTLSEVFVLYLVIGLIVLSSTFAVTGMLNEAVVFGHNATYVAELVRLMALGVFVAMLVNALSLYLRAMEQIPSLVLVQNIYNTGVWIGVLLVATNGGGLRDVLLVGIGLFALQFMLYLGWLCRSKSYRFMLLSSHGWQMKGVLGYSTFAFVSQLSAMVTYHVDRILVGILSSVSQVAYYAVPANIVSRLLNVGALFNTFVFPRAITLHAAGDYEGLRALYIKASRYTFLLLVPVMVPLVMLAPELLTLWLGDAFAQGSQLTARILLVAFFIASISITPSQIYNGMGNSRIGAYYALVCSSINVLLCLVLIPQFGATGAAVASLVAMLQALVYRRSLERTLKVDRYPQRRVHLAITLVALVQAAICGVIHLYGLISDIITAFLFLGGALLVFYLLWLALPSRFNSQERELCRMAIARFGR
jgi:O-antigen/teichoic acid export membrane protein